MCLVISRGSSCEQAFCMIQNGQFFAIFSSFSRYGFSLVLPLFNPTTIFLQNLERFQVSPYMARSEQLIVKNVVSSPSPQSNSAVLTSSNIHEPNGPRHITPINGHGTDLGVCIDSNNLKVTGRHSRLLSLSFR